MRACGCLQVWLALTARLRGRVSKSIGDLSYLSALNPWKTLLVCVAVTAACSAGFARLEVVSDGAKLWVDQKSPAFMNREWVSNNFGENAAYLRMVIQARNVGENALTVPIFKEALTVVDEVRAVVGSQGQNFEDLCQLLPDGECYVDGPMRLFGANATAFDEQVSSQDELLRLLSAERYPQGDPARRDEVFGKLQTDGSMVASAQLWRIDFALRPGIELAVVEAWQEEVLRLYVDKTGEKVDQRWQHIHVEVLATHASLNDELARAVGGDIGLMAASFAFLALSCAAMLGHPLRGVRGRRLLGAGDFFLVLLATAAGYGLAAGLGFEFTSLQQILPFILVGIGVDNAFVIADAYDRTARGRPIEERVRQAMVEEGMSVTLASLTNFVSFMIGATASFPAVSNFCIYAAISVLFIYVFHLTAFCSMLALDARRQGANRLDVLCCIRGGVAAQADESESFAQKAMVKYTKAITCHAGLKLVIIAAFLGFGASCAWETIANTDTTFEIVSIIPDDSYVRNFLDAEQEVFGGTTFNLTIGVELHIRNVDMSDAGVQARVRAAEDELLALKPIAGPLSSWHREFTAWALANRGSSDALPADQFVAVGSQEFLAGAAFDAALRSWLADCRLGCRFSPDVVWAGDRVAHSRTHCYQATLRTSNAQADALAVIEKWYQEKDSELPGIFVHSEIFIYYQSYQIIQGQLFQTSGGCFLAVVLISMFVISHPTAIAIMVSIMVLVFVVLMGAIPISGLSLNSVSMINLVMAIGLVVDYIMHIAHSFMAQEPSLSRDERVANAMSELGVSVAKGILSTAVAIVPLAFAGSHVFRVFFIMFAWILGAGALHGLLLLPVVLSLVGPAKLEAPVKTTSSAVRKTSSEVGMEPHPSTPGMRVTKQPRTKEVANEPKSQPVGAFDVEVLGNP